MGKGTVAVGSVANKAGRHKEVELPNAAIKKISENKQQNTKQILNTPAFLVLVPQSSSKFYSDSQ